MSDPLLIYGASGFTGRLLAEAARARGLEPILGGRDPRKLAPLATRLGCAYRTASLDAGSELAALLDGVRVVLHAAGPFSRTAAPMVAACLAHGVHYLDLGGETAVLDALSRHDDAARRRGTMIMPGVGFDVVPSDCLAAHVARRLPRAQRLVIGLTGFSGATRGSTKTLVEQAGRSVPVRRAGTLVQVPPGAFERHIDYGAGPRASLNVGWGDVVSAYYTTGIGDVETYVEATPAVRLLLRASRRLGPLLQSAPWQALAQTCADLLPETPTPAPPARQEMVIVAEVEDGGGRRARARLRTPEAYAFSGVVGAAIAERVLRGDLEPGFQTPGRVYGPDFVLGFAGVAREDL